jgi:predicted ribosome quality control (RQC) complex YloA/Tae2 family protein
MENREIIDKTYYLLEESTTKDRTPGFFYCTIMADKSHMFFHVQQGPGAHVVVMSNNIDEKLKRFVANIAAYYSSYKNSSTVPVNYTLVKNIKKIPGGKPGKVIINNQKTVYVDPDYSLFKDFIVN